MLFCNQAVNELLSQHWTKWAKVVLVIYPVKKIRHICKSQFSSESTYIGRNLVQCCWRCYRKILVNVVLILLGQHCTGKYPMQCCPWEAPEQQCTERNPVQCCLNTLGTTWHRYKNLSNNVLEAKDNNIQEKISRSVLS